MQQGFGVEEAGVARHEIRASCENWAERRKVQTGVRLGPSALDEGVSSQSRDGACVVSDRNRWKVPEAQTVETTPDWV